MNVQNYEIKNSFHVNGWTVLTLNKRIPLDEYRKSHILIGENKLPYSPAHEGYLIAVKGEHNYTGQTLTFVD